MIDDWLSFHSAVQEIERAKDIGRGKAQAMLRQLCASGEIRSQKQPHSNGEEQGPWERIEPSEWRNREIDLMTDADGCQYFVDVSEIDFRGWLGQPARQRPAAKRDIARQAINAIWPNGISETVSNKQIETQVSNWLKQQHGRSDIGRDTVLRAAGRKP